MKLSIKPVYFLKLHKFKYPPSNPVFHNNHIRLNKKVKKIQTSLNHFFIIPLLLIHLIIIIIVINFIIVIMTILIKFKIIKNYLFLV